MDKRGLIALVVILAVAGTGFVALQLLVGSEAENILADTEISIRSLSITSTSQNGADFSVVLDIDNPSQYEAQVNPTQLNVHFNGSLLGSFDTPEMTVAPGLNTIQFNTTLTTTDSSILTQFLQALILESDITLRVTGDLTLNAAVTAEVTLDRTVTLPALDGLRQADIANMTLEDAGEDSITFAVAISLFNPTDITFHLTDVVSYFYYQGRLLGNLTVAALELEPGDNVIDADLTLFPENRTAAQDLATRFLAGQTCDIVLELEAASLVEGLQESILLELSLDTEIVGLSSLDVTLNELQIVSISDNEMTLDLNLTVSNPSTVVGQIPELLFEVLFNDTPIGTLSLPPMYLFHGDNIVETRATLSSPQTDALNNMMTELLSGRDVDLTIRGSGEGNLMSAMLAGWNTTITIQSQGALIVELESLRLISPGESSLVLGIDIGFWNPTDFELDLTNVTFDVFVNTTERLGLMSLGDIRLQSGWNNISAEVEVTDIDPTVLDAVTDRYVNGKNTSLHIVGIDSGGLVGSIISSVSFDVELTGVSPYNVVVISIDLMSASDGWLLTRVQLNITNPMTSNVTMENLNFTVSYESQTLGNISLPILELMPGTTTYTVETNFTVTNNTLFNELLNRYLTGSEVPLTVRGAPGGTDILSMVLADYETTIILPAMDLDVQVVGFDLVGTTSSTVHVVANITLTNPLSMNVTLQAANLTLAYQGSPIGNLTLGDVTLTPGVNLITVDIYLSQDYNESAITELLSNYLNGITSEITVWGWFTSDLGGIIAPADVEFQTATVLVGIEDELLQSISIDSITISLTTWSITIDASAVIFNPLSFDVNITSMSYDIYFDDDDGASMWPYSYPPRNDIFLATVTHDYSSDYLEIQGSSTATVNAQVSISDTELAVRLYDEYYVDNDLHVDILNGQLTVRLGAFEITLAFSFTNMYVPNS